MSKIINNINELMLGDIVQDGINGGYAEVKQCLHGNKYYAVLSWQDEEDKPILDHLSIACDTDIDYIPCCG